MIRNLKIFGMLAAVFAMSATVAASASAAAFTSASSTTTLTANQSTTHKLTVTGVGISCTTVSFHGHEAGTGISNLTITPTYTGCTTDTLGLSAKVTGFGHYGEEKTCDYVLHAAGTADLVCQTGAEVDITAGACSVKIPAQKGLSSVSYENGSGDINASVNITNISGTHADGFGCPFSSSGSFSNGTLTGSSTVTGSSEGKPVSISWDE